MLHCTHDGRGRRRTRGVGITGPAPPARAAFSCPRARLRRPRVPTRPPPAPSPSPSPGGRSMIPGAASLARSRPTRTNDSRRPGDGRMATTTTQSPHTRARTATPHGSAREQCRPGARERDDPCLALHGQGTGRPAGCARSSRRPRGDSGEVGGVLAALRGACRRARPPPLTSRARTRTPTGRRAAAVTG